MIKNIFHYVMLTIFLVLAYYIHHPHFFRLRAYELVLLPLISALLILFYLKQKNYKIVFGYTLVIAIVLFFQGRYYYDRHKVFSGDPLIVQKLSRHTIVGYDNLDELKYLISKTHIAGIFVNKKNIKDRSYDEIKETLNSLQKGTKYHLLISTDHEGGMVSKFSPPLTKLPPLSSIDLEDESEIIRYATTHAKGLSDIGINLNFAPVVDLKYHNPKKKLHLNTQIEKRAIASDPLVVSRVATLYTKILEEHQVVPTLKHFPGIAKVINDTHHFRATLDSSVASLQESDWIPFRTTLKNSNAFLMLSHVILTKLDPVHPVSTSKKVVQSIIRQKWNHNGLLITDDMSMGAIFDSPRGICGSSIDSLNAGVDIVLISYDFHKYYRVVSCLMDAYRDGELDKEMLEVSDKRLESFLSDY